MMSAIAFSLIAVCLALFIAAYRHDFEGSPARICKWAAVGLAPVLILATTLPGSERSGDFRLKVTGLALDRAALEKPFCVGGNDTSAGPRPAAEACEGDDLTIDGLPSGFARLVAEGGGAPAWRFDTTGAGSRGETGVAAVVKEHGLLEIAGSIVLKPGASFCVVRCDRADRAVFVVNADGTGLERANAGSLPRFKRRPLKVVYKWEIPTPLPWFWPADQAIYPLRDYGVSSDRSAGDDLCRHRQLLCDSGAPVRSFIYRISGGSDGLRILLLDPGAHMLTPAEPPIPTVEATSGKPMHVRLFSVDYGAGFEDLAAPGRPAARLRPRASFVTAMAGKRVSVTLSRPFIAAMPSASIRDAARGNASEPLPLTITSVPGNSRLPLVIDFAGGKLARNLETRIILQPDDQGLRASGFIRAGQSGTIRLGVPFLAGDLSAQDGGYADASRAAVMQLERLDLPAGPVPILLMLAALACWGFLLCRAQQLRAPDTLPAWFILAVVQWLITIRLTIGIESAMLDPRLDLAIAIGGNVAAIFTAPLIIAACTPGKAEQNMRALLPCLIFALGAILAAGLSYGWSPAMFASLAALLAIFCFHQPARHRLWVREQSIGVLSSSWMLPAAASLTILAGLVLLWRNIPYWHYCAVVGGLLLLAVTLWHVRTWLVAKLQAMIARRAGHERQEGEASSWWMWLLVALVAGRIFLLLAFNVKERIYWPTPFAVSILYVPLLLTVFAALFAAVARGETHIRSWLLLRLRVSLSLIFAPAIFVTLVVIPFLVSDLGLAMYALPVSAMGWVFAREHGKGWPRLPWRAPVGAMVAGVLVLGVWGYTQSASWRATIQEAVEAAGEPADAQTHNAAVHRVSKLLADVNAGDQNELRLWRVFAPDRVVLAGTSEAESQRRVSAILQDYTGTVFGRGYGAASNPGDIRPYQADDNVAAIHLISPYGRVGAALFLFVLGILARRLDTVGAWSDTGAVLARLTLWTMFSCAAYMILANLQLVPFTGRNIYFMAALSISDLVEGTILLLIALRGLVRAG